MTRRGRSFVAARRATAQISDREGAHRGQGLLLEIPGEGAVVLTCHHIIATLPPGEVYVRLPGEDGSLGAPHPATYDRERSHPASDAVVLRLEGVTLPERPLLQRLDPSEYSGNVEALGLTHLTPTSFNATLSISTQVEIDVPTPDSILPPGSKYLIPHAFRLAYSTDAKPGISGAVVVRNGAVLGLAQSARRASDYRLAEVYLLPLSVWAEGWGALSDLIGSFAADPYDDALQDYLRALRIFSTDTPYLALDELLGGAKRSLHEVYVPLLSHRVSMPSSAEPAEEEEEKKGKGKEGEERNDHAGAVETESEQDTRLSEGITEQEKTAPSTFSIAGMLRAASKSAGHRNVLLQGAAGIGKSTALRHITEHAFSRPHRIGLEKPHLPVVLRLQAMSEERGASIEEWLLNGLRRAGDLALERTPPAGFFSEWSTRENAPWLLLLDGLDEVAAEHRGDVLRWVEALLQKLEGQHLLVMTSRPAGDNAYKKLAGKFTVYDVLTFDEGQQVDFASRWFPDAADDFIAKVRRISTGNVFREALELTPLLLTIAAAVYRRDGDLPESGEAELFGKFIDILFEEAERRGLLAELKDEVSDVARGGLERLALAMTERPTENTLAALAQVSADFLREELEWGETRSETRGRQFAEVMVRRAGVLYRRGDTFQWVHPTIREHLAAHALDRQLRRLGNDYTAVIGERLLEQRWHDVLWNLTLIHQDRQALVRWMSREARDNFDADAALLAYDFWKDREPAFRDALKSEIVGALAGGLGDSQSSLSLRGKLLRHLTQMGVDVTGPLITLLDEYNGLQSELLPDWDGDERPDIDTEPGRKIRAGLRLRDNVIQVLGDVGDERAVEPLISLLDEEVEGDSFRWQIAQSARLALRCIGVASVAPLLARIGDATLPVKVRLYCLTALGVIGIRSAAVTPILDLVLREGLDGNAELLARSLSAAYRLGDGAHRAHAISALASDDVQVVSEAAKYLKLVPDESDFSSLDRSFNKWLSNEEDSYERTWTLQKLAAALLATHSPQARRKVTHFIKSGLQDKGKLPPDDALEIGEKVRLLALPRLLLNELIRQLNLAEPGIIVDQLVTRLGHVWRPEQTKLLVDATRKTYGDAVAGGNFASKLIDICVGDRQGREGQQRALRDYLDRKDVLRLMAKCQVPDFVSQAERLLSGAKFWMVSQISDAMWVVSDPSAEGPLIAALHNFVRPTMQADRSMPEEYDILRALSMCCTARGAQAILSYMRENPNLSIHLPEEVLVPLVRRGVLDVDTLLRMAQDLTRTHEFIRRACVLAIGYLDAPHFPSVFLRVVESDTDEQAQAYAATFLGWAKGDRTKVVKALRGVLMTTERTFLATRAAQALVRLKSRGSLRVIEGAAERFRGVGPASGLLRAAARFRERSTLAMLSKLPARSRPHMYLRTEADITAAFGEFYQTDVSARARVNAQLEPTQVRFDSGKQRVAIGVLARCNPNWLLRRATELYDEGSLEPSARAALINHLPRLSKSRQVNKEPVVGLMKRLLCEAELSIREPAGESLQFVDPTVRHRIYSELRAMSNEWAQACAVYSLGFWDSDESVIKDACTDPSLVVRRLASTAAVMRSKRRGLRQVAKTFRTTGGLERLSSYYSLLDEAPESLVGKLYRDVKEDNLTRIYLREIGGEVERRVKEERKKRAKDEEDWICEKVRHVSLA